MNGQRRMPVAATRAWMVVLIVVLPLSLLAHCVERQSEDSAGRARLSALARVYAELTNAPKRVSLRPFAGASAEYFATHGAGPEGRGCLAVVSGPGYRSDIELAVAFKAGQVAGVKVLAHAESPGFGARVLEDALWRDQFVGLDADADGTVFASTRQGGRIDAISGATITSEAAIFLVLNTTTSAQACAASAD